MPSVGDWLPEFDVRKPRAVSAPPEEALAALLRIPVAGDPIVRALFRFRGLGVSGSLEDAFERMDFTVLARTPTALVVGGSGRPWRPRERLLPFAESGPGTVRLAADFRAEEGRISTETRVQALDGRARRAFRAYWLLVGPFSALIRRRWLAAAAAQAAEGSAQT